MGLAITHNRWWWTNMASCAMMTMRNTTSMPVMMWLLVLSMTVVTGIPSAILDTSAWILYACMYICKIKVHSLPTAVLVDRLSVLIHWGRESGHVQKSISCFNTSMRPWLDYKLMQYYSLYSAPPAAVLASGKLKHSRRQTKTWEPDDLISPRIGLISTDYYALIGRISAKTQQRNNKRNSFNVMSTLLNSIRSEPGAPCSRRWITATVGNSNVTSILNFKRPTRTRFIS